MSESPSQPIRYRRATAADATALAALGAAVWIHTYCDQGVPTDYTEYVLNKFTAQQAHQLTHRRGHRSLPHRGRRVMLNQRRTRPLD